jgi:hypothetical protein
MESGSSPTKIEKKKAPGGQSALTIPKNRKTDLKVGCPKESIPPN